MIENKTRNYGIDLLRIVAMYFVVVLHICNQSGIEKAATTFYQQGVYYLYKTLTCIAVNVVAMVSGYVGYGKSKLKISRLLELWMIVVFYGVVISAVLIIAGSQDVGYKDIIKAFLPVTLQQYWYFSAYAGLFFLMPLINTLVRHLSAEGFFQTAVAAVLVFSFYGIVSVFFSDPFILNGGYSLIWLAILYYLGAGIKRFGVEPNVSQKKLVIVVLMIWLVNACFLLLLRYVAAATRITYLSAIAEYLFHAYVSPAVMALSLAVFFLFAKLKVRSISKKILLVCSASAFSVYLIHHHPLVWNSYFRDASQLVRDRSSIEMLFFIPAIATVVFFVCLAIDIVRAKLFALTKIHIFVQRVEQAINKIFEKIVSKCRKKCALSFETTLPHDSAFVTNGNHEIE